MDTIMTRLTRGVVREKHNGRDDARSTVQRQTKDIMERQHYGTDSSVAHSC